MYITLIVLDFLFFSYLYYFIDEMEVNTTILFFGIANTYYELGNFEKASSAINKSLLVREFALNLVLYRIYIKIHIKH